MSAPDRHEYESLIAAQANRELTIDERARLDSLVAGDVSQRHCVEDLDAVLALFEAERSLSGEVAVPVGMEEAADEGYQRLEAAAARSESQLRAHLQFSLPQSSSPQNPPLYPAPPSPQHPPIGQGPVPLTQPQTDSASPVLRPRVMLVAALLIASLTIVFWPKSAPEMMTQNPGGEVLGTVRIHLDAELHGDLPVLRWQPVLGADRYEAQIYAPSGEEILHWTSPAELTTRWELESEQYSALRARAGGIGLKLRISAYASDRRIARSADLPLLLVD